jgi:phosphatidylglycerophosphate synthase
MQATRRAVLTRANGLTALRLLAAPALVLAICTGRAVAALALFVGAVATDLLDGRVARRFGETSALGGLLDHATDALFVSAGLGALAAMGRVPTVLPVLILTAFVQYALDSQLRLGKSAGLRGSALGRWNGIAYFVLLGIPVVRDGLGLAWPSDALVERLAWGLVVTTLVSMGSRLAALGAQRRRSA